MGPDNPSSDASDFKRALDLLDHVSVPAAPEGESDLADLRLHVFARAVLRDDWLAMDVDNPAAAVEQTVLFRLAELCYLQEQVRKGEGDSRH